MAEVGLLLLILLGGCEPGGSDAVPDASSLVDEGAAFDLHTADASMSPLAECSAVFGCVEFTDATAPDAARMVQSVGNRYVDACIRIKAGQTVLFASRFVTHPLAPACGLRNPIMTTRTGTMRTFTFDAPGLYGYFCKAHGRSDGWGMAGAIEVIP